jgi:hypothetical protein
MTSTAISMSFQQLFTYGFPLGTLLSLVGIGISIGSFKKSFDQLKKSVDTLNPVVTRLNSCVQEIQSILKNKYKTLSLIQETIDLYGQSNSPVILRDEFRPFILKSGIDQQVEENKKKLVQFLEKQKPATGLDAQNILFELVVSDAITNYIHTKKLKKILYEEGKTTRDYYLILAIYLFETIIPEVISS